MPHFDPKSTRYPYPEDTSAHYIKVVEKKKISFDEDYPYIDRSKGFAFKRFWVRFLLTLIVFPLCRFIYGLKIEGKENLKKHSKELKNGFISVANHVCFWDFIFIHKALRPRKPYTPVWDKNVTGPSGPLVRLMGGIPIPVSNMKVTLVFNKAILGELEKGNVLHVYPEGSMWEYYAPIRPFKKGAFYFSIAANKPILPLAFSYRKPSKIASILFHSEASFTLRIGEPIFPDSAKDLLEAEEELTKKAHASICALAGFEEGENPYPPIYNHSKKVD